MLEQLEGHLPLSKLSLLQSGVAQIIAAHPRPALQGGREGAAHDHNLPLTSLGLLLQLILSPMTSPRSLPVSPIPGQGNSPPGSSEEEGEAGTVKHPLCPPPTERMPFFSAPDSDQEEEKRRRQDDKRTPSRALPLPSCVAGLC